MCKQQKKSKIQDLDWNKKIKNTIKKIDFDIFYILSYKKK